MEAQLQDPSRFLSVQVISKVERAIPKLVSAILIIKKREKECQYLAISKKLVKSSNMLLLHRAADMNLCLSVNSKLGGLELLRRSSPLKRMVRSLHSPSQEKSL